MQSNWKPDGSTRKQLKFGDGQPIPYRDLFRITTEFWRHAAIISWRAGDVLVLDNRSVAHGRMPFRGKREILGCVTHVEDGRLLELAVSPPDFVPKASLARATRQSLANSLHGRTGRSQRH